MPTFVWDGDGNRVSQTIDGVTTYFIGNYYEKTGSTVTKYYYSGGQRIAMRKNGTLYYMFSDHLGSTSITTDSAGNVISEMRYKPWGETRYAGGNTPTQYTFTGQRDYTSDFGLMYFNARWVDVSTGRFAQADTVIPQGQGVQAWDRYAYTNNSPINYTDPSGHRCVPEDECGGMSNNTGSSSSFDTQYGISFTGDWEEGNQGMVRTAVRDIARAFLREYNRECRWADDCESYSVARLFRTVYDTSSSNPLVFQWGSCPECKGGGGYTYSTHRIAFASLPISYPDGNKTPEMAFREGVNNVVHELGHAFAHRWDIPGGYDNSGPYGTGMLDGMVNNEGFYLYPDPVGARLTWRQHPCTTEDGCPHEVFADMFLGWTYGKWASSQSGIDRATFMDQNMGPWIVNLVSP